MPICAGRVLSDFYVRRRLLPVIKVFSQSDYFVPFVTDDDKERVRFFCRTEFGEYKIWTENGGSVAVAFAKNFKPFDLKFLDLDVSFTNSDGEIETRFPTVEEARLVMEKIKGYIEATVK